MSNYTKTSELREKLAAIQHEIWAHWMKYLLEVCIQNEDGTYTIPRDEARQWQRQIMTHYQDLSENEKNSDREQADRILAMLSDEQPSDREELI